MILDSDILIQFLRKNKKAIEKIEYILENHGLLATTSINAAELYFGACLSKQKEQNKQNTQKLIDQLIILPFSKESALIYGEIRADLQDKGDLINDLDIFIASIVIEHNSTLITNNTKHFQKITKLQIDSW